MNDQTTCAQCGKSIARRDTIAPDEPIYCSFSCEVKALVGKTGWGLRWFLVSMGWGLAIFALLLVIARPFVGAPVANPAAYFGLIVVLALIVAILSLLLRRMKP